MKTINFYLFSLSFVISINLFANIKSKIPLEISESFTSALQKANSDKQVKLELSADTSNIKLSDLSNYIAEKNQLNYAFKTETISLDIKVNNEVVGYIKFKLGMGDYNKRMPGESSSINRIILPDDHFAYLDYIKIQDIYQGKGFGSEALLRFNQFLDDMGISYTVLYVESDTKYAANTYRKKGFNFITDTFDIIRKRMGEEAYLKDSSSKLLDENEKEINPMMIRWRQGDETRALRLRKYVMNLSSADFEKKFEEYLDYLKSQSLDMKKILEKTNNEGKTAWNEAINANNLKAIVRLIEIVDQRIISQKGEEGNTALHLAVEWENYELVEILLNTMSQEAINQQSNDGLTALHLAVDSENLRIVQMLLKAMSTEGIQAKNKLGRTSLDWAVRSSNKEISSLIRQQLGV